jgi:outer membrane protein assembly factor BamB
MEGHHTNQIGIVGAMKRFKFTAWLALVSFTAFISGCSALDAINPFAAPEFPPAKLENFKAQFTPKVLWTAKTSAAKARFFQPAVLDGVVYSAAEDGTIQAIDLVTGKLRWKVELKTSLSTGIAAGSDVLVVVGNKGEIIALDLSGKQRWKTTVGAEVITPPLLAPGLLLVKTADSRLIAYDAENGSRRWVYSRSAPTLTLRSIEPLAVSNGLVVAGFAGGKMVVISLATGVPRWEATVANPKGATEIERIADVTGKPSIVGRDVCVSSFQGRLGCFDLVSGNPIWLRDFSSPVGVVSDEKYVVGVDEKSFLYAFSLENGSNVWKSELLLRRQVSAPVLSSSSAVVADFEGYLHWFAREDGKLVARVRIDDSPLSGPLLVVDKTLLAQTRSGILAAIALD